MIYCWVYHIIRISIDVILCDFINIHCIIIIDVILCNIITVTFIIPVKPCDFIPCHGFLVGKGMSNISKIWTEN